MILEESGTSYSEKIFRNLPMRIELKTFLNFEPRSPTMRQTDPGKLLATGDAAGSNTSLHSGK